MSVSCHGGVDAQLPVRHEILNPVHGPPGFHWVKWAVLDLGIVARCLVCGGVLQRTTGKGGTAESGDGQEAKCVREHRRP